MPDPTQIKAKAPSPPKEHPIESTSMPRSAYGTNTKPGMPGIPTEYLGGGPMPVPKPMPTNAKNSSVNLPPVITPPTKEIPPGDRKVLEKKAQDLLKEISQTQVQQQQQTPATEVKKKSHKMTYIGLTAVTMVLVGIGIFAGIKMLNLQGSQEDRSVASTCSGGYCWCQAPTNCSAAACMDSNTVIKNCYESSGYPGGGQPCLKLVDECSSNDCLNGSCGALPPPNQIDWCTSASDCEGNNQCLNSTQLVDKCCDIDVNGFNNCPAANYCWKLVRTCNTCSPTCTGTDVTPPPTPEPNITPLPGSCDQYSLGTTITDPSGVSRRCEAPQSYGPYSYNCSGTTPMLGTKKVSFATCSSKCNFTWQAVSFCAEEGQPNCPWNLTNGQCCPTGADACNPNTDNYQCIDDPFVSHCEQWGNGTCAGGGGYWSHVVSCNNLCDLACAQYEGPGCCNPTNPPPNNTPTPSPTQPTTTMVCSGVTMSPPQPAFGETVTLTCGGTPSNLAIYADFQLSADGGAYQQLTNKTAFTAEYKVTKPGTYSARCRMCTSADKTECTAWQTTQ